MQDINTVAKRAIISVVDDDESMRQAINALIGSMGFGVEEFSSAEEFLNSERSQGSDCLILDVRMAGLSGLELQRRLAADHKIVPIVFITAHYSEEERTRAMAARRGRLFEQTVQRAGAAYRHRRIVSDP